MSNIAPFTAPQVYIFPQQPLHFKNLVEYNTCKQSSQTYEIVDFLDKRDLFPNIDHQAAVYNSQPDFWNRRVEIYKEELATPRGQYFRGLIQPILCKNAFYFLQTPTGELLPVAFCRINCPYIHNLALKQAINQMEAEKRSPSSQEAAIEEPSDFELVESPPLSNASSAPLDSPLSNASSTSLDSPLSEVNSSNSSSPSHTLGSSPSLLQPEPDSNTLSPNDPPFSPTTPPKSLSKGAAIVPPKARKCVVVSKKD